MAVNDNLKGEKERNAEYSIDNINDAGDVVELGMSAIIILMKFLINIDDNGDLEIKFLCRWIVVITSW